MAITESSRHDLGAHVVAHRGDFGGKAAARGKTATGLMHVGGNNFLIPPSTETTNTHTGPLAQLTEEERAIVGLDQPQPSAQPVAVPVEEPAEEEQPKRRSRAKAKAEPQKPKAVKVNLMVPGLGTLPSQYAHCYEGKGVLVLGLTDMSYVPSVAARGPDGQVQGKIALAAKPAVEYVFAGNEFTDSNGVRNIILVALPGEKQS